jgi:phosphoribosyl 1,2-cyclic phosphodiesterase
MPRLDPRRHPGKHQLWRINGLRRTANRRARPIIIDAGSGIRELGSEIARRGTAHAHLLLSHGHYDHLMGLPFFSPVYDRGMKLDVYSGHTGGAPCTRDIIAGFMKEPYLPVTIDLMCANMRYHDIEAGSTLDLGHGISARSCPTNHPAAALPGGWIVTARALFTCLTTNTEKAM